MPNGQGGWVWLNSQGRVEGKGTTSKARQARRFAANEKDRWESGEVSAYAKRQQQAQEEAAQTRSERRVQSRPPPARSVREHQQASAAESHWMTAGKHGKRQKTASPVPLKKGTKPSKEGNAEMEEIFVEEDPVVEAKLAELKKQLLERPPPFEKREQMPVVKAKARPQEPLKKGTPPQVAKESLAETAAKESTSSSSKPLEKGTVLCGTPLCKKVALDWHLTMADSDNKVRPETMKAVEKLLDHGVEVYILSYGSAKREAETRGHAQGLPFWSRLGGALFTRAKTGLKGKAILCKKVGIEALFDDNAEIMRECWEQGVWPFPISSWHCHSPLEKGSYQWVQPRPTLEEAIDLFLSPDCKFRDWMEL